MVEDVEDTVTVRSDPPDAVWLDDRMVNLATLLGGVLSHLRTEHTDVGPGVREIVLAEDLTAAIRSLHGVVHGVEGLQEFSTSRLGGVVIGKTMFRDEHFSDAVIVMDSAVFRSPDDLSRIGEIFVLGHELAHALIGQVRRADDNPRMAAAFLPWETSRWFVRYALEEYKADRLAQVMLAVMGTVTVDGETRPFRSTDFKSGLHEWVDAAARSVTTVGESIDAYRLHQVDLTAMWRTVELLASEVLITLAHAQAEADELAGDPPIVTEAVAAEVPPLHRLWSSLTELGRSWKVLQDAASFHAEEATVLDTGRDALLTFWEEMGLTFRPEADGYYITVAAPELVWQPRRA
jgi:hypothetical protein